MGCAADVMQAVAASFTLSAEGVLPDGSMEFKVLPSPTDATLPDLLAACPAAAASPAPSGDAATASQAQAAVLSEDIVRTFASLSRQAEQRFTDVSSEARIMGTTTAVRRPDPSADPDLDDESVDVPVPYALNTQTEAAEPARDGYKLVTQRQFLVPTDEAYELMTHGTADVVAGGVSTAYLSRAGQVLARLDSSATEVPLPAGPARRELDPTTGKARTVAEAVIFRTRLVVLMARNPTASTASAGGSAGSSAGGASAAQQLAASLMPGFLASTAADLYPGGYGSFMAGWKQQLAENSRRRRQRRMQQDLGGEGAAVAAGAEGISAGSAASRAGRALQEGASGDHMYTGSLFNKSYGFEIAGLYSGISVHVTGSVLGGIDATLFGINVPNALALKSTGAFDVTLDGEGYYAASNLTKTATLTIAGVDGSKSEALDATPFDGDSCDVYKNDNKAGVYESLYSKSYNVASFSIRFVAILLPVTVTFSVDAEFSVYNGLGGCSHNLQQPAYATGGGVSGSLVGSVSASAGVSGASATVTGSVTLVKPSVTAVTYWTAAMALYGSTDDPMCSSLTLDVSGLGFSLTASGRLGPFSGSIDIAQADSKPFMEASTQDLSLAMSACLVSYFSRRRMASTLGKRWACDAEAKALKQLPTTGVCLPEDFVAIQAFLAPDGRSITIVLSAMAMPMVGVPCSRLFDGATSKLLSNSTTCTALFNIVFVKLSGMETITVNSSLGLSNTTALVTALSGGSTKFSGSAVLTGCGNDCAKPVATLRGSLIGELPCDTSVLAVTITSWLGTNASASVTLRKAPSPSSSSSSSALATAPSVSIGGGSTQTFLIANGIHLAAEDKATCGGDKALVWAWSSPSNWSGLPAGNALAQPTLFVPGPVNAKHGDVLNLTVRARYADANASAVNSSFGSATVTLTVLAQPPGASLTGPTGDTAAETALVLDATASRDPDASAGSATLTFVWECKRADYPTPCFSTSNQGDQATSPGKWTIPAGLLTSGVWHTFTVRVSKSVPEGTPPLESTATLKLRPRPAEPCFPRGTLRRLCAPALCSRPHPMGRPLDLMLTVEGTAGSTDVIKSVVWSSDQAPSVATLKGTGGPTSGVFLLTIPPASLPSAPSITVAATMMNANGTSGVATLTIALSSAPYCSDTSTPAAGSGPCLAVTVVYANAPNALVAVQAFSWSDIQDSASGLMYEFGLKFAATSIGGAERVQPQQYGAATSAALYGMPDGTITVYGCAVDTGGARTCSDVLVSIGGAASGGAVDFSSLDSIDAAALLSANNPVALLQSASQAAGLFALVTSTSSADLRQLVAARSAALVQAVASSAALKDFVQAQQAVSVIEAVATAASPSMSDSAKQTILAAATAIVAALPSGAAGAVSLGAEFVTRICRILGGSAGALGNALAARAAPGGSPVTAGGSGVFITAAALLPGPPSAGSVFTTTAVSAGPGAAAAAASPGVGGNRRRSALTAATAPTDATVNLVLQGTTADLGTGAGIDVTFLPAAATLLNALVASVPPGVTIKGGVTAVSWNPREGSTAAAPALGGSSDSFLELLLPVPEYDVTKGITCLMYNATSGAMYGLVEGLAPGDNPPVANAYDAATGRMSCTVTAFGVYVVAQGQVVVLNVSTTTLTLNHTFVMDPAKLSGNPTALAAFSTGLQAALAAALGVRVPAVNISLIDTTTTPGAVHAVSITTIDAARLARNPAAGLLANTMAALPADFVATFRWCGEHTAGT
ncbi:hypothetical protein HYH03_014611 [Edaphochlamys debaryana]|uniref:PKD/REJ-like domain-containing protein n=1 Tax=Edaphochlamys debaryana TaxID=47281 RepID=A0A835XR18_9CHLO|nr:hypothetical protein HYH03_014611 [Edaphochlamys debaryana]|eukprot:KAG2486681.1 hypothetical protein HYH03_014611 [Edaphochlamys debaryana]